MTGRGEGYCVLELPEPGWPEGYRRPARGYAGLEGVPVHLEALAAWPARLPRTAVWRGPAIARGRGWAPRRGRGRRLSRW
jgi:hypothetical protein